MVSQNNQPVGMVIAVIVVLLLMVGILIPYYQYNNGISGQVVAKALITESYYTICELNFSVGWNLFSIYCTLDNAEVSTALGALNGKYLSIHAYDAIDTDDPWKSYNPDMPAYVVQDLKNIYRKKGYWINMNDTGLLVVNSSWITPTQVDLVSGWNLVGYTSKNTESSANAFYSILSHLVSAHIYNVTDPVDHWKTYNPNLGSNISQDLNFTYPLFGYWIRVNDTSEWRVNW